MCNVNVGEPRFMVLQIKYFIKLLQNILTMHMYWYICYQTAHDGNGNVSFNDTLNTCYFTVIWHRTYGKGLLFPINSKGSFIYTIPQTG